MLFGKFNNEFSITDFSYGYFTFWLELEDSCRGSTAPCSHPFQVESEVTPQ